MNTTTTTPRIYVACLAAYNNGELHGEWIDADQSADAIRKEINKMLATSPEPNAEVTTPAGFFVPCSSFVGVDVRRLKY
jgi:antirestriction protein